MNAFRVALFGLLVVAQYLEYQGNGNAGLGAQAMENGILLFDIIPKRIVKVFYYIQKLDKSFGYKYTSGIIVDKERILIPAHAKDITHFGYFELGYNNDGLYTNGGHPDGSFKTTEYHTHPEFKNDSLIYDIGLIKLEKHLKLRETENTPIFGDIDLPQHAGVMVRVYGYGNDGFLRYAELEMVHANLYKRICNSTKLFNGENENSYFIIPFYAVPINEGKKARVTMKDYGGVVTIIDPRDNREKVVGIIAHIEEQLLTKEIRFIKVQRVTNDIIRSIDSTYIFTEFSKPSSEGEKPEFKYYKAVAPSVRPSNNFLLSWKFGAIVAQDTRELLPVWKESPKSQPVESTSPSSTINQGISSKDSNTQANNPWYGGDWSMH